MLGRVVGVQDIEGTMLRLKFDGGVGGEITVCEYNNSDGLSEPLKDRE